ncbi:MULTISPECIES: hypothetical protein [Methylosinus]|uniref:Uncharacterized protein n=1 Tax=Methylosinus trichosporium (strain ATCC 35070 / NCIMB 11131 / UNIQEM 75 / OB3b) TaxID=595536 RepID=A0A2D2D3R4_METT3|nr:MULTISPECIES: hypothetical protein [Methylosinus]ATQ69617.1 hypothetical protein CQW49_18295 [Methylosinus trichosporium OB3b]OBS52016.1 hypothetical protein A8B73_13250 [Methylosinus sp. 3S-1]
MIPARAVLGGLILVLGSFGAAADDRIACPLTLDVAYTKVAKLDFGAPVPDEPLDIEGFEPRVATATVRLIAPDIAPGADAKNEISYGMADNAETAKPGELLVFTIWAAGEKAPVFPAFVTCHYEGGLVLQRALPASTRACTLRSAWKKSAPNEPTTRQLYTRAEFTCRQ